MGNILSSLLFRYKKRTISAIAFAVCILMGFLQLILRMIFTEDLSASLFAIDIITVNNTIATFFLITNTAFICTDDFGDKTANYEIMTGHTRLEVFMGRVVMSLITGVIGYILIQTVPVLCCAAIYGWGNEVTLSSMILRGVLILFPVMRIICETSFLSFIIRKPFGTMISGIIISMFILTFSGFGNIQDSVFLCTTNMNRLISFSPWATYGLRSDANYITYDSFLSSEYVLMTIAASVGFGLLFCFMGYSFFRQDDID